LAKLFGEDETVRFIANQQRWREAGSRKSPRRILHHGLVANQPQQLLGIGSAGEWPQPRARTAAQDYGVDRRNNRHLFPISD